MILVCGASGQLGGTVARKLAARILTRDNVVNEVVEVGGPDNMALRDGYWSETTSKTFDGWRAPAERFSVKPMSVKGYVERSKV